MGKHVATKRQIPAHAYKQRKRYAGHIVGSFLLIITLLITSVGVLYASLQNNVKSDDIDHLLGDSRPTRQPVDEEDSPDKKEPSFDAPLDPFKNQDINILILGSDIRDKDDPDYGEETEGMRADTTLLAHISADRNQVDVISIPRDSWVEIPACERRDGSWGRASVGKFNSAFAIGGARGDAGSAAACAIKTVESLTDVYIDAYAVVDFTGFEEIVGSLGGVTMCVPELIDAPKAHLYLEPGNQEMDGETALGYARARSGVGLNGSDISRIDRQQGLFKAIANKALDSMNDIPTLYGFLDSATSTLTVSPEISSLTSMAGIVWSLRHLDDESLNFTTVPVIDLEDGSNVAWTTDAQTLWDKIINDDMVVSEESTEEGAEEAEEGAEEAEEGAEGEETPESEGDPVENNVCN